MSPEPEAGISVCETEEKPMTDGERSVPYTIQNNTNQDIKTNHRMTHDE